MKKIFALILLVVMCTSCFAGCSKNNNNQETSGSKEQNNNESTQNDITDGEGDKTEELPELEDWNKLEIIVDGHVITLPCTYKKITELTGFVWSEFHEKSEVESGWYMSEPFSNNEENACWGIGVKNFTDKDAQAKDCTVVEVFAAEGVTVPVIFGGLQIGDEITKQELIKRFGEPAEVREWRSESNKENETDTYYWYYDAEDRNNGHFYITLNIYSNLIEEISLSPFHEKVAQEEK